MLARSGKIGWFSSSGPNLGEVVGVDVVDPEDRVRIAHVDHRRRMQDRLVDRPDLQFDGAGVAEFLGQRNLVPAEARLAHVDGEQAARALPGIEQPAVVSNAERALAGLLRQQRGDAAHAVAAGAGFGAVVVVDADEGFGAGRARRIKRHQLIVGRALGGAAARASSGAIAPAARAHVDHDDLVAETVHLHEGPVGERAHGHRLLHSAAMRGLCPGFARFIWRVTLIGQRRDARMRHSAIAGSRTGRRNPMSCLRLGGAALARSGVRSSPPARRRRNRPRRRRRPSRMRRRRCSPAMLSATR